MYTVKDDKIPVKGSANLTTNHNRTMSTQQKISLVCNRMKMSGPTHHFLTVLAVVCAAQFINAYSFNNCIQDPKSEGHFNCINRHTKNLSAIIHDLPSSVINLTVSINPVQHIPNCSFAHLPQLQNLRLDHNRLVNISQLAFENLHYLQSLNLSFNFISQLNPLVFSDLHNLTSLSLTSNKLKQLPETIFSSNHNLNSLIISQNCLKNFSGIVQSVSHLSNLKKCDLCFNNLTSLHHSNRSLPKSLTILYLCKNNLSTLGCESSFLANIMVLDFSYNYWLPTRAFLGVDIGNVAYLRIRSTSVAVVELLKHSNVKASCVDFSGTRLKNNTMLMKLCKTLKGKIKTIKKLQLASNEIKNLGKNTLDDCPPITGTLDLSHNNFRSTNCVQFLYMHSHVKSLVVEHNHLVSLENCSQLSHFISLEKLSYRYNRILSVSPYAFHNLPNIKTLQLNINTIAYLDSKAFKGLTELEELRLDNNLITDLFKGSFEDNVKLQILNLRNNHISVIFNGTFHNLSNLIILDLGGNKITHFQPSGLDGLTHLSNLYLDGNNLKEIDTSLYRVFQNTLKVLDLHGNYINFFSPRARSPFMHLRELKDLKLDRQQPFGLMVIPSGFFRGLKSLTSLYLTNNYLNNFAPDAFDDLISLNFLSLDNCCAGIPKLQPGIFKNLRNLTRLTAENMGIQNFSKEIFGNLTKLRELQLNRNVMQSIPLDTLHSLPNLHYLDIRNIPLSCTCKNRLLQNWTRHNLQVQIVYLYNLMCQENCANKFYNFDTKVCYIDLGHYIFLSTAAALFLFTVSPLLYAKLYWKFKYGYYVFRSWFSEQWRRLREEEENCKYDAFISYNSHDEQWVMDQLMPNLEGNGSSFKLCLHHRDFELGRDIVDNIVSAVYSSRKTICVVSRHFLQSEWCSLEIQLASYRLFDEHRDVLLLVFLEPLTDRQVSSYHRMRKVMLNKTYLQWPGSNCPDPATAQELFWNQLRRAMRAGSKQPTEESNTRDGTTEHFETCDEDYYLLP